jgi:hypothetical protein
MEFFFNIVKKSDTFFQNLYNFMHKTTRYLKNSSLIVFELKGFIQNNKFIRLIIT